MHPDRNAMALYVKVVESGSFSKTAIREGVPVSTVSRKIADLEKALGVRLLERSTRRLRMTEIGQDYFERCRLGLAEFDAANSLVTERRTELSGRLRISIPPSMSDIVILPLINAFQAIHPGVTIHCLVTERFVDHIADGIDFSLRVGHSKDSSLIASTLTIHRPRLVAAARYMESIPSLAHPHEVPEHVKIAFSRWERPVQWTLISGDDTVQISPEPRLVLNDYAGVLQGLRNGMGISETPSFICEPWLQNGQLVEVLPQWVFETVRVTGTYPSNRHLSPVVRSFKDFCVKYFERKPLA